MYISNSPDHRYQLVSPVKVQQSPAILAFSSLVVEPVQPSLRSQIESKLDERDGSASAYLAARDDIAFNQRALGLLESAVFLGKRPNLTSVLDVAVGSASLAKGQRIDTTV